MKGVGGRVEEKIGDKSFLCSYIFCLFCIFDQVAIYFNMLELSQVNQKVAFLLLDYYHYYYVIVIVIFITPVA
jgi:hypothetical protein